MCLQSSQHGNVGQDIPTVLLMYILLSRPCGGQWSCDLTQSGWLQGRLAGPRRSTISWGYYRYIQGLVYAIINVRKQKNKNKSQKNVCFGGQLYACWWPSTSMKNSDFVVITLPADGLAPDGARPSADTLMTYLSYIPSWQWLCVSCMIKPIKNLNITVGGLRGVIWPFYLAQSGWLWGWTTSPRESAASRVYQGLWLTRSSWLAHLLNDVTTFNWWYRQNMGWAPRRCNPCMLTVGSWPLY